MNDQLSTERRGALPFQAESKIDGLSQQHCLWQAALGDGCSELPLPQGAASRRPAAMQRLRPVYSGMGTHADWHQAVAGPGDPERRQGQLYEVQR